MMKGGEFMDIMVAAIAAFITIFVLYGLNIDKTSSQLMLLGIELTVLGGVFIITLSVLGSIIMYYSGVALIVIGFIVSMFGFTKK